MKAPEPDRPWAAALAVFEELVGLDEPTRRVRLESLAATDPGLRTEVERLLEADSRADGLLARFDGILGQEPREVDPLHLTGRTVSHFRVIEPLARGGMGVVYRAEDTRLGRQVALKFPLASRFVDPAAKQRFRQEARLAAALDHPNLCPVYEIDETPEGELFYSMPIYEGETLKARLAREGRLPLGQAVEIAVQLAQGLGAAHRVGIAHRDLKPGNVMLLPDGTVKILDFGLAKARDVSLTVSTARLGTIAYMAPEQVEGAARVDQRADLWSLGVLLYEMATGSRPFAGGHEIGVAHAILHEEPARASALLPEIPGELDDVLRTLLRKDPAVRYASAEELAAVLRRIRIDQNAAPARKTRPSLGVLRWPLRRRSSILAGAALLTAAGAALAWGRMTAAPAPVSIAVLPFDFVGDSADTHHLAVGMSDAIATDLARLRGIVAPSYLTVTMYRDGGSLSQLASEHQVRFVLRATVQRLYERVRVDAQLIDAEDGRALWDRRLERPLGELSELEREIVRRTVAGLRVRTRADERDLLERPGVTHGRAYDLYLRGRALELEGRSLAFWFRPVPPADIRRVVSLYSQARDLEPGSATVRARLALMHALSAATYDRSDARREQARVEAETALRLRRGHPDAHDALAAYWSLKGDVARAVAELGLAVEGFPHSADLRLALGDMLARAGRLEEAAAESDRAMRLEPGNARAAFLAAMFYARLRRREEAMRRFDHAIAAAPEAHMIKVIKGQSYLRWKGIPDTLAAAMRSVPADWDPDGMATYGRFTALWAQRRYADGLTMLDRSRSELSRDRHVYEPAPLMRARLLEALGEPQPARASYAAALAVLRDSVAAHPTDAPIRIALALTHAGLGHPDEAVREARHAMELVRVGGNTVGATAVMAGAVEVFGKAGETDAALELLELLFTMPAGREVTPAFLRVWPAFDPLRSDPRFEDLLVRFADPR